MKVSIGFWWSHLQGSVPEMELVSKELTFQSPHARFSKLYQIGRWDGMTKLYKKVTLMSIMVRTGLLSYLRQRLPLMVWEYTDSRVAIPVTGDIGSLDPSLRDYQEEAVLACLRQKWGIVSVPTGGGKTHIAAGVLKGFDKYTGLYLVHRRLLAKQIQEYLETVLKEHVGLCVEGKAELSSRVVVALIQSLYARIKTSESLRQWLEKVPVIVIDECHHVSSPSYQAVLDVCRDVKVCVGLSGTVPEEQDSVEYLQLRGVLGEVIYSVRSEELRRRGFIVGPRVTMYSGHWEVGLKEKMRSINWSSYGAESRIWQTLRQWSIIENDKRNAAIEELLSDRFQYRCQGGVIVIVDLVQHGEELARRLGCQILWANKPDKEQLWADFKSGKEQMLVCSPVLDEGMDLEGIRVVVLAGGGKSRRQLLQRIGRGMRKARGKWYVEVVDMIDTEIPMLERHTNYRRSVYEQEGFQIEEAVLDGR